MPDFHEPLPPKEAAAAYRVHCRECGIRLTDSEANDDPCMQVCLKCMAWCGGHRDGASIVAAGQGRTVKGQRDSAWCIAVVLLFGVLALVMGWLAGWLS